MACIYKNEGFLPLAIYITTSLSVFLFSLSLHVVLLRIKHMTYFLYKIFLFFPLSLLFLLFCFSFLVIFTWLWYTIMFMQNLEQAMIWIWRRRCKIRALAQLVERMWVYTRHLCFTHSHSDAVCLRSGL